MRPLVLAIFAAILAVGAFGATAHALSLLELQQAFVDEVADSTSVRVEGKGHTLGGHISPDTVTAGASGVVASFEVRTFAEFEAVRIYFDGARIVTVPEIDGDGLDDRWGYINYVDVVFGLMGEPTIVVSRELQTWYWGGGCAYLHTEYGLGECDEYGMGPFPKGDYRGYQSEPNALWPEFLGCQVILKENDKPLRCLYPLDF